MTIEETLAEREITHGSYKEQARHAEALRNYLEAKKSWYGIPGEMRWAITMILMKITRIVFGKPFCKDHWRDIAGYATLIEQSLTEEGTYKHDSEHD